MTEQTDGMMLIDHKGRPIRLTAERRVHILEHPEMSAQFERLVATLAQPDLIVTTNADPTVHVTIAFI